MKCEAQTRTWWSCEVHCCLYITTVRDNWGSKRRHRRRQGGVIHYWYCTIVFQYYALCHKVCVTMPLMLCTDHTWFTNLWIAVQLLWLWRYHSLYCFMVLLSMTNVLVPFLHCSSILPTISASVMAIPLTGSWQVTELLASTVAISSLPVLEMTQR